MGKSKDTGQGVPRIAVIGAGVGGLTCALVLAHAGLKVTVFERNERIGGKLNLLEAGGFSWDMGPSLLTMPYVFEQLWHALGRRLEDYLTLVPLSITCRYRWADGTIIDEDAAFWQRPEVARFLAYARGLYDISAEAFLHHPPQDWWRQLKWKNIRHLRHLPKIASFRTMHQVLRCYFDDDPHLMQLFSRFATYNGSSPYKTHAAFNIIPYVQAAFGGHYVEGGMYQIALALERLCRELNVEIRAGAEVTKMQRTLFRCGGDGRMTASSRYMLSISEPKQAALYRRAFNYIVCNQDVLSAYPRFLPARVAWAFRRQVKETEMSMSGFILYLGVARKYQQLEHHNIFFSDNYAEEFEQLFGARRPADNPTIYVAVNSKSDPHRAPRGCDSWFVLVNAPALAAREKEAEIGMTPDQWAKTARDYGDHIIGILEDRFGFDGLRAAIRARHHFTPADFEARYVAQAGSLYGLASHGVRAAFRRPAFQPAGVPNFYFVGGSTHPGGGLPLVCLSGQMVARKIIKRLT